MIAAVTFDAAGTLFRLRTSPGQVYCALAREYGAPCSATVIEQRFWEAYRQAPPLCFPGVSKAALEEREKDWWKSVVRATFAGIQLSDFDSFFERLYGTFADPHLWVVYADAEPALAALRARGRKLAVVSNFDRRLYGILAGLGLAQWFDAVVVSSEVGSAKPDPEIFRVASSRLSLAPTQLAHVGDREEDVVGAERAGLRAWRIRRDGNPGPGEIRSLLELPSLVEG